MYVCLNKMWVSYGNFCIPMIPVFRPTRPLAGLQVRQHNLDITRQLSWMARNVQCKQRRPFGRSEKCSGADRTQRRFLCWDEMMKIKAKLCWCTISLPVKTEETNAMVNAFTPGTAQMKITWICSILDLFYPCHSCPIKEIQLDTSGSLTSSWLVSFQGFR